ncbi:unnamed protein product [Paramecium octaurelia]|uniref:Uncharacterized protein n=1 Tax=Paramecium octaurelia TaxID=43137 RepID=A0A8S1TSP5_PAROT|nr:unnamed protein product [Paramecium octaurelia]
MQNLEAKDNLQFVKQNYFCKSSSIHLFQDAIQYYILIHSVMDQFNCINKKIHFSMYQEQKSDSDTVTQYEGSVRQLRTKACKLFDHFLLFLSTIIKTKNCKFNCCKQNFVKMQPKSTRKEQHSYNEQMHSQQDGCRLKASRSAASVKVKLLHSDVLVKQISEKCDLFMTVISQIL